MERREQRVEMGVGSFHNPPRAQYSEETRNLIKMLMEESKLSMMQRKSIQSAVDRGEPLPTPTTIASKDNGKQITYPCYWKKRSQEAIVNSGAYEREQYRRTTPLLNKDKQKRHLACMMAYGKDLPETPHGPMLRHRPRREPEIPEDIDPLDDLVQGIRERMDFLQEMESLGLSKKYRPIIQQEIAQKIRMIDAMDKKKSAEVEMEFEGLKYERPPPKPFPIGELDDE
ncbi:UPF0193 protein EVG1 homolog [Diachasma alloeum]|uniref:UPF0193 protein EVG1 homolog n=1 Tax=Diachasma alloeum TaxID=454923 RepID=UPI0007382B13|nr:UPF0193 protein EVG1 homolog [Diachasma alloeum]